MLSELADMASKYADHIASIEIRRDNLQADWRVFEEACASGKLPGDDLQNIRRGLELRVQDLESSMYQLRTSQRALDMEFELRENELILEEEERTGHIASESSGWIRHLLQRNYLLRLQNDLVQRERDNAVVHCNRLQAILSHVALDRSGSQKGGAISEQRTTNPPLSEPPGILTAAKPPPSQEAAARDTHREGTHIGVTAVSRRLLPADQRGPPNAPLGTGSDLRQVKSRPQKKQLVTSPREASQESKADAGESLPKFIDPFRGSHGIQLLGKSGEGTKKRPETPLPPNAKDELKLKLGASRGESFAAFFPRSPSRQEPGQFSTSLSLK